MNITIQDTEYNHLLECKEELEKRKFREESEDKQRVAYAFWLKYSGDYKTKERPIRPPELPSNGVINESHSYSHRCAKCGSTSHKIGFLGLFGERVCDNKQCENSKSKFL